MPDKKILAIFDFDDTLFMGQSHSYFLAYLESKLPVYKRLPFKINKRMVWSKLNDREQKEFILAAFRGVGLAQFEKYAHDFFSTVIVNRLHKSMCLKLKEHRDKGHTVIIASGGFDVYLQFIKEYLGIDNLICTRLKFNQGVFDGGIAGEECLGQQKANLVHETFTSEDADWGSSYVYSDHKSDIPLFNLAENKIVIDFGQKLDWVDHTFTRVSV